MTARERVLAAFSHREPDRVPVWYGAASGLTKRLIERCRVADEEALLRRLGIDFRSVRPRYVGPDLGDRTIWGVRRGGAYYGQPLTHPLADAVTVEQVEAYPGWPSPDWFDCADVRARCEPWRDFAITGGPWAVVFTDATELVGMETFFERMYTHPDVMEAVLRKVSDVYYEVATRFFAAAGGRVDIFFFGDDMGTQQAMLISPEHWRRFCRPHVERFAALGRQAGVRVMFHCCGSIRPIIGDLCDAGVDALNPIQVRARQMDLAELKHAFGRRLTFHGCLDHQQVLPRGTADEVRAEVRRVIGVMAPGGGFCLAPSHDLLLDEFPVENVVAMYDEATSYGWYSGIR